MHAARLASQGLEESMQYGVAVVAGATKMLEADWTEGYGLVTRGFADWAQDFASAQ